MGVAFLTFFAGARTDAFLAGALAVVLVTRPDLVLERTVLDSTTAGAATLFFLGADLVGGLAALFLAGTDFLTEAGFVFGTALVALVAVLEGLVTLFLLFAFGFVAAVLFLAGVTFLETAGFFSPAGLATFGASLVVPDGPELC